MRYVHETIENRDVAVSVREPPSTKPECVVVVDAMPFETPVTVMPEKSIVLPVITVFDRNMIPAASRFPGVDAVSDDPANDSDTDENESVADGLVTTIPLAVSDDVPVDVSVFPPIEIVAAPTGWMLMHSGVA